MQLAKMIEWWKKYIRGFVNAEKIWWIFSTPWKIRRTRKNNWLWKVCCAWKMFAILWAKLRNLCSTQMSPLHNWISEREKTFQKLVKRIRLSFKKYTYKDKTPLLTMLQLLMEWGRWGSQVGQNWLMIQNRNWKTSTMIWTT